MRSIFASEIKRGVLKNMACFLLKLTHLSVKSLSFRDKALTKS